MTILLFLIVIAGLILVHELGHFLAAKSVGARVDEFGLGFPPRLFSVKYGETEYSLNLIPFGGFVKILGETPGVETDGLVDMDRSLNYKPRLQQAWVLVAGVFFNWLLAWLLISGGFMSGLPMSAEGQAGHFELQDVRTTVIQVTGNSPAEVAGLLPGDQINYVASAEDLVTNPSITEFQTLIKTAPDLVTVGFVRDGVADQVSLNPSDDLMAEGRAIGVALDTVGTIKLPWPQALITGFGFTLDLTGQFLVGLKDIVADLFQGHSVTEAIVGPVGIAGLVGDAGELGLVYLLTLVAVISLNLAIINLLPLPALDGGRLLILLIEAIKGSPINARLTNGLNLVGFLILIGLMIVITVADVLRLF